MREFGQIARPHHDWNFREAFAQGHVTTDRSRKAKVNRIQNGIGKKRNPALERKFHQTTQRIQIGRWAAKQHRGHRILLGNVQGLGRQGQQIIRPGACGQCEVGGIQRVHTDQKVLVFEGPNRRCERLERGLRKTAKINHIRPATTIVAGAFENGVHFAVGRIDDLGEDHGAVFG